MGSKVGPDRVESIHILSSQIPLTQSLHNDNYRTHHCVLASRVFLPMLEYFLKANSDIIINMSVPVFILKG